MKAIRKYLTYCLTVSVLSLLSCEKPEEVGPQMNPQLVGTWKLDAITYGLTQVRVQGDSLPYTETLTFEKNRNYLFSRFDKPYESGLAYAEKNTSQTDYKLAVFYEKDQTYQPFKFTDGRLLMYQRSAKGSITADGDTFEYKRQ